MVLPWTPRSRSARVSGVTGASPVSTGVGHHPRVAAPRGGKRVMAQSDFSRSATAASKTDTKKADLQK